MTDADKKTAELRTICLVLYGLYAITALAQFWEVTLLFGLLGVLFALAMSYHQRKAAEGTPFESHLHWQIRTFWIGTGLIVPVVFVLALGFIWGMTNIDEIITLAKNGGDPQALVSEYMHKNYKTIVSILTITVLPGLVWWLRRCWVGYALAKENKPIEKVMSWL